MRAGHFSVSDLVVFTGAIGGVIVLIFTITVIIFAIAIVVLCKAKARLGKQLLNHHRKDTDAENKIYEEIDQNAPDKNGYRKQHCLCFMSQYHEIRFLCLPTTV